MCEFFSFLTDGNKKLYYFNSQQRKARLKFRNGISIPNYDSHTCIARYFGLNEDDWSKGEYNPFSDKITIDQQHTTWDDSAVRRMLKENSFNDMCGDVEGVRSFLQKLKEIKWTQPDGTLKEDEHMRLFDTYQDAEQAITNSRYGTRLNRSWKAAWDKMCDFYPYIWYDNFKAVSDAVYDVAKNYTRFLINDITFYILLTYVYGNSLIEQKHLDYVTRRMDVWRHGYGVAFDVDGVLYCYERME